MAAKKTTVHTFANTLVYACPILHGRSVKLHIDMAEIGGWAMAFDVDIYRAATGSTFHVDNMVGDRIGHALSVEEDGRGGYGVYIANQCLNSIEVFATPIIDVGKEICVFV